MNNIEIEKLLDLQTDLSDIASELYGEMWITNDKFWGSVTERQMALVTNKLFDLGYEYEPNEFEKRMANKLKDKYKNRKR